MQRKTPFASDNVVVEGLDQPLLDDDQDSESSRLTSAPELSSRAAFGADLDRKVLQGARSIRKIRSNSGRNSAVRGIGTLGHAESDVAFKITVRSQSRADFQNFDGLDPSQVDIDVCHDTVSEAIQGAVETAVQEVVQDAVQGAVQDAVQQVMDDTKVKFDVRANFYTLIAITGVVIFWRGVWTSWDYFFGFKLYSELGAVAVGLVIMITFRLVGVPLLDGLPSG